MICDTRSTADVTCALFGERSACLRLGCGMPLIPLGTSRRPGLEKTRGGVSWALLLACHLLVLLSIAKSGAAAATTPCLEGQGINCTAAANDPDSHSWVVQRQPTMFSPFVFFHQRKSGGSSWRGIIYQRAMEREGLRYDLINPRATSAGKSTRAFIPCFTHPCPTWNIPNPFKGGDGRGRIFYIFAGHLSWSNMRMSIAPNTLRGHLESLRGLTNFRDPVERVVSCLRYRFKLTFPTTDSLTKMAPSKLRGFLLRRLSHLGYGCNNEPLRILSGYSDELEINSLGLPQNRHLADVLVEQSKRHMLSSVVAAVLEHEKETIAVVNHYFPWLKLPRALPVKNANPALEVTPSPGSPPTGSKESTGKRDILSEEQRQVILELNRPEVELYDFARKLLLKEYERLRNNNETTPDADYDDYDSNYDDDDEPAAPVKGRPQLPQSVPQRVNQPAHGRHGDEEAAPVKGRPQLRLKAPVARGRNNDNDGKHDDDDDDDDDDKPAAHLKGRPQLRLTAPAHGLLRHHSQYAKTQ